MCASILIQRRASSIYWRRGSLNHYQRIRLNVFVYIDIWVHFGYIHINHKSKTRVFNNLKTRVFNSRRECGSPKVLKFRLRAVGYRKSILRTLSSSDRLHPQCQVTPINPRTWTRFVPGACPFPPDPLFDLHQGQLCLSLGFHWDWDWDFIGMICNLFSRKCIWSLWKNRPSLALFHHFSGLLRESFAGGDPQWSFFKIYWCFQ